MKLTGIFMKFHEMTLKVTWKSKEPTVVRVLLKKENRERRFNSPEMRTDSFLKLYNYKATIIKDSVYWYKNKWVSDGIEQSPETNPSIRGGTPQKTGIIFWRAALRSTGFPTR